MFSRTEGSSCVVITPFLGQSTLLRYSLEDEGFGEGKRRSLLLVANIDGLTALPTAHHYVRNAHGVREIYATLGSRMGHLADGMGFWAL
jgi:hypothetical protein